MTLLKKLKAPKIDGKYIAIIHPSVAYDLRSSEAWIEAHKYAGLTELFTGEIGELHGVRFIETTEAKIFNGEGCPVKTEADESKRVRLRCITASMRRCSSARMPTA